MAIALCAAWCLLVRRLGTGDVYAVMGPFSLLVSGLVLSLRRRALLGRLRPAPSPIATGLLVGVATTLATYPAFDVCTELVPSLRPRVRALYEVADAVASRERIVWVVSIVLAEELLFRGLVLEEVLGTGRRELVVLVPVVSYALAQWGTGSAVVLAMALVMGTIWTLERLWTGSLLAPLISHLVWTLGVIVIWPVL